MSASPRVPDRIGENKFPFLSNTETGIVAHAGGGQTDAYQLAAQNNRIDMVATGGDSVRLPKIVLSPGNLSDAGASIGTFIFVCNAGANPAQIFGDESDTINGAASGTG